MNSWPDAAMPRFRNEKNSNRKGAYRLPAMVRWPGKIKAGMVSNDMQSTPFPANVGDFNADGNPDILWRNISTGRTTVWYMDRATWNGNWGDVLPIVSNPNWSIVGR